MTISPSRRIGYDLVEYSPKNWNLNLKKNIVHIDFTPAEVDTYYPPTIEIAADIEYTIEVILNELDNERQREKIKKDLDTERLFQIYSRK
jgi:acetolactate synthase-1/2/3 large subunit